MVNEIELQDTYEVGALFEENVENPKNNMHMQGSECNVLSRWRYILFCLK